MVQQTLVWQCGSMWKISVHFDGSNCYMRISNLQGWLYAFMCNKVFLSYFQLTARWHFYIYTRTKLEVDISVIG